MHNVESTVKYVLRVHLWDREEGGL